jgi:hypothetical protein
MRAAEFQAKVENGLIEPERCFVATRIRRLP